MAVAAGGQGEREEGRTMSGKVERFRARLAEHYLRKRDERIERRSQDAAWRVFRSPAKILATAWNEAPAKLRCADVILDTMEAATPAGGWPVRALADAVRPKLSANEYEQAFYDHDDGSVQAIEPGVLWHLKKNGMIIWHGDTHHPATWRFEIAP